MVTIRTDLLVAVTFSCGHTVAVHPRLGDSVKDDISEARINSFKEWYSKRPCPACEANERHKREARGAAMLKARNELAKMIAAGFRFHGIKAKVCNSNIHIGNEIYYINQTERSGEWAFDFLGIPISIEILDIPKCVSALKATIRQAEKEEKKRQAELAEECRLKQQYIAAIKLLEENDPSKLTAEQCKLLVNAIHSSEDYY